jgi:Amt family ammonium transporter
MVVRKWLALSVTLAVAAACFIAPMAVVYADATKVSADDTAWILTSSALVLLMTAPGLTQHDENADALEA